MRIIVYFIYRNGYGDKVMDYKVFTDRIKALRFIKMVDGKNFNGRIHRWECDCEWDNEWLFARHIIGRKEI